MKLVLFAGIALVAAAKTNPHVRSVETSHDDAMCDRRNRYDLSSAPRQ